MRYIPHLSNVSLSAICRGTSERGWWFPFETEKPPDRNFVFE
jgi:hypothetical protein